MGPLLSSTLSHMIFTSFGKLKKKEIVQEASRVLAKGGKLEFMDEGSRFSPAFVA
jgi:hypothetical protein